MSYDEVLKFLFNSLPMFQRQGKSAYKANLDNTHDLDKYFKKPHQEYKTIHVAGTNGKGSVSHIISSVLQQAGYNTGLYTSPHLFDFRERIKVAGQMIDKNFVCEFINNNYDFFEKLKPSFFEITVAMAFEYFKCRDVDVAVVETGMGGRLDSTNIINPELSIITNIGLDHTYFLGNTISKIAKEKSGIIKKNNPVIIGEKNRESTPIFIEKAKVENATIYFAENIANLKISDSRLIIDTNKESYGFSPDLKGDYQKKNYLTATVGIEILKNTFEKIEKKDIISGFENVVSNTGFYGRWETVSQNPTVLCDTAHNKEGLEIVLKQLMGLNYNKLHFVIGFVNDKNVQDIIKLFPKNASYYFTQADIPRALNAYELEKIAHKYGIFGKSYNKVEAAYFAAKESAQTKDLIFVGGSTFVTGDFLKKIKKKD